MLDAHSLHQVFPAEGGALGETAFRAEAYGWGDDSVAAGSEIVELRYRFGYCKVPGCSSSSSYVWISDFQTSPSFEFAKLPTGDVAHGYKKSIVLCVADVYDGTFPLSETCKTADIKVFPAASQQEASAVAASLDGIEALSTPQKLMTLTSAALASADIMLSSPEDAREVQQRSLRLMNDMLARDRLTSEAAVSSAIEVAIQTSGNLEADSVTLAAVGELLLQSSSSLIEAAGGDQEKVQSLAAGILDCLNLATSAAGIPSAGSLDSQLSGELVENASKVRSLTAAAIAAGLQPGADPVELGSGGNKISVSKMFADGASGASFSVSIESRRLQRRSLMAAQLNPEITTPKGIAAYCAAFPENCVLPFSLTLSYIADSMYLLMGMGFSSFGNAVDRHLEAHEPGTASLEKQGKFAVIASGVLGIQLDSIAFSKAQLQGPFQLAIPLDTQLTGTGPGSSPKYCARINYETFRPEVTGVANVTYGVAICDVEKMGDHVVLHVAKGKGPAVPASLYYGPRSDLDLATEPQLAQPSADLSLQYALLFGGVAGAGVLLCCMAICIPFCCVWQRSEEPSNRNKGSSSFSLAHSLANAFAGFVLDLLAFDSRAESTRMRGPARRSFSYQRMDTSNSREDESCEQSEDIGSREHSGQSPAMEQHIFFTDLEEETFKGATREPGTVSPSSRLSPALSVLRNEAQKLGGKNDSGAGIASDVETGISSPAILAKGSGVEATVSKTPAQHAKGAPSSATDNSSGVETHANVTWSSVPESDPDLESVIPSPALRAKGSQIRTPIPRGILTIGSGAISKLSEPSFRTLLEAARTGSVKVVQRSLVKGGWACIDARDQDGNSVLHVAAANGHKDIIESLLSMQGMSGSVLGIRACLVLLQVKNTQGRTALHLAARAGHLCAVEALLCPSGQQETAVAKQHQLIDMPDHDQRTPIHLAAINGHFEVLEMLIRTAKENYKASRKMARRPSSSDDSDQVKIAFQSPKWPGLGFQDKDGWTAYHHAAAKGHVAVLETLIAAEGLQLENEGRMTGLSDANVEDWKSWTALHVAASCGQLGAVEVLLRHPECWPNRPDRKGWTALHVAAFHGRHEVAAAILRWGRHQGVDVDVLDHNGASAMTLASTNGKVRVVREILKAEKMLEQSLPLS